MNLNLSAYRNVRFSANIVFLYLHRLLVQVGAGMVSIFLPIFFYEQFDRSISAVVFIFVVSYLLYALFVVPAAFLIGRFGIKRLMLVGMPLLIISYVALAVFEKQPILYLFVHILTLLGFRLLYWVPYHIDLAKFTDRRTRGKQLSLLMSLSTLILATMPFMGGVIIGVAGFKSLFFLAFTLFLISMAPLFFVRETKENFSFGYSETFAHLLQKKNRPLLIAYAGNGMQNAIRIVVWPIFIFGILSEEFIAVGIISSVTVIALIVLRFVAGHLADTWSKAKLLKISSIFYMTGWIFKIFVDTGFEIFIVDTYHSLGRAVNQLSFVATSYEQAADQGHYIDEYTVMREIAMNMGKVIILLLSIALISFFSITTAFILAAIATLFMVLLSRNNPGAV